MSNRALLYSFDSDEDEDAEDFQQTAPARVKASDIVSVDSSFDRTFGVYSRTERFYTPAEAYQTPLQDKSRTSIPNVGVYAEAGIGGVGMEYGICEAKSEGPNIAVRAHASPLGVGTMVRAEIASVSGSAGPFTFDFKGPSTSAAADASIVGVSVMVRAETGSVSACAGPFTVEFNGPSASAAADVSMVSVGVMARAEIGSVSASAGQVTAKVGLGVDTGMSAGIDGLEVKVLGTGITIGTRLGFSILGSGLMF